MKALLSSANMQHCCSCSESGTCHLFELVSSTSTFLGTQQANKLPLGSWSYFGLTAQSGWQPPSHALHKLICINVCASLVQVRLLPHCWMEAQLQWLGALGGVAGEIVGVRLASYHGQ